METPERAELRELIVDLVTNSSRFARLAASLAEDDRPKAVVRALSLIDEYDELRIGDFAELDRCSQPAATGLLKKLHAQGLIERRADPLDSRVTLVSISDEGRHWLDRSRTAIGDALAPRFAELEPEQITRITDGLSELRRLLKTTANDERKKRS